MGTRSHVIGGKDSILITAPRQPITPPRQPITPLHTGCAYNSHIQFFKFKVVGMIDRLETCRVYRATIPANMRSVYCSYPIL